MQTGKDSRDLQTFGYRRLLSMKPRKETGFSEAQTQRQQENPRVDSTRQESETGCLFC